MSSTAIKAKRMNMPEIKDRAQVLGITPGRMKKTELIHAIQRAEGNNPCFGSSNGQCPYTACCFMNDCLKIKVPVTC